MICLGIEALEIKRVLGSSGGSRCRKKDGQNGTTLDAKDCGLLP
jgi:hypothetical protein